MSFCRWNGGESNKRQSELPLTFPECLMVVCSNDDEVVVVDGGFEVVEALDSNLFVGLLFPDGLMMKPHVEFISRMYQINL